MAKKMTRATTSDVPETNAELNAIIDAPVKTKRTKKPVVIVAPVVQDDEPEDEVSPIVPAYAQVFVDSHRHSYLDVGTCGNDIRSFMTMRQDCITVEHIADTSFLTPIACLKTYQEAVRPYITSKLPKSPLASKVLDVILDCEDVTQSNFVGPIVQSQSSLVNATKPAGAKQPKAKKDKVAKTSSVPAGFVTLASILAEINMDGKKARIVLRKNLTKPEAGWAWAADEKDDIIALLTGKAAA